MKWKTHLVFQILFGFCVSSALAYQSTGLTIKFPTFAEISKRFKPADSISFTHFLLRERVQYRLRHYGVNPYFPSTYKIYFDPADASFLRTTIAQPPQSEAEYLNWAIALEVFAALQMEGFEGDSNLPSRVENIFSSVLRCEFVSCELLRRSIESYLTSIGAPLSLSADNTGLRLWNRWLPVKQRALDVQIADQLSRQSDARLTAVARTELHQARVAILGSQITSAVASPLTLEARLAVFERAEIHHARMAIMGDQIATAIVQKSRRKPKRLTSNLDCRRHIMYRIGRAIRDLSQQYRLTGS